MPKEHPIDRLAREQDITKRYIAREADLSEATVSDISSGKIPCGRRAAVKLNKRWGLPIDELICWPDEPVAPRDPGPSAPPALAAQDSRRAKREKSRRCTEDGDSLPDLTESPANGDAA